MKPVPEFTNDAATSPLGEEWDVMTFPMYRPLLRLVGTGMADANGCRPVARTARAGGQPVGLVVAELPTAERPSAELLSVFVAEEKRGLGIATALIAGIEGDLARLGSTELTAVYMAGKPGIDALERVLQKRGFSPPQLRKVVVQATPEEVSRTDWFRRAVLPSSCTIFPWADLPREEYEGLKRSQDAAPWIPEILEPWSCGEHFDVVSSVGLHKQGDVVGWVITHRVPPNLVRYTSCFVRADLQRWGLMLPLLVASVDRLMGTGALCTFVTTSQFPHMVAFTHRRLGPFVSYCGETRGVSKTLVPEP
jgi:GNAT superfamily N-acetyltransferase